MTPPGGHGATAAVLLALGRVARAVVEPAVVPVTSASQVEWQSRCPGGPHDATWSQGHGYSPAVACGVCG